MTLDIIIPAYNAHKTIFKTLSSIAIQRDAPDFQVTIVNDCSDHDYSYFVSYFEKYYPIQEISTLKNGGPGVARNEGMRFTGGDYITFIDSDDFYYSPYSLKKLYESVFEEDADLVIGNFLYERDYEKTVKEKNLVWLHGKMYKREFLEEHDIHFNDSRANEDNGFNRLILLMRPIIHYVDETIYVYCENSESITRQNDREYKVKGLEGLSYNVVWAMKEAIQRNASITDITSLGLSALVSMYYYYLEYQDEKIFQWTKPILDFYNEYPEHALSSIDVETFLLMKKDEYKEEGRKFSYVLDFDEFLEKVGDVHD